jgi:hypothetical protein
MVLGRSCRKWRPSAAGWLNCIHNDSSCDEKRSKVMSGATLSVECGWVTKCHMASIDKQCIRTTRPEQQGASVPPWYVFEQDIIKIARRAIKTEPLNYSKYTQQLKIPLSSNQPPLT